MKRASIQPWRAIRLWRAIVLFALSLCAIGVLHAEVPVPPLNAHVIDQTGTLNSQQKNALEHMLSGFEASKGSQIAILMVPTTRPESIEQYSIRVVDQWRLGRKNIDDGVLVLVAKQDREMRIEVGYGLEGALTDATSHRIIEEILTPYFKRGDFYEGLNAGATQIMHVIEGEPLPPPQAQRRGSNNPDTYLPLLFLIVLAVGGGLRRVFGRLPAALAASGVAGIATWLIVGSLGIAFLASLAGFFFTLLSSLRQHGTGFYFGGDRHRGGFGGGGFGGGGGGFGGGGASGRW